jgi:hypothetical protein
LLFVLGCCVLDGATPRWQLLSWALEVAALVLLGHKQAKSNRRIF